MSLNSKMTAIADGIRAKTGKPDALTLDQMAESISEVYTAGRKSMVDESKLIPKTVSGSYISVDDVSEVPHEVACKVESVNLLQGQTSGEANGLVWTANEDGSITINGTATETTTIKFTYFPVASGEYFISGIPKGINTKATVLWLQVNYDTSTTTGALGGRDVGNGANFIVPNEAKRIKPYVGIYKGLTVDNVTIYPMLNRGSTVRPYTPYVLIQNVKVTKYGADESEEYQPLIPAADGTVEGMTSVSPCMNIYTDTEGVNIEATYNKSWGMQTAHERFYNAFRQGVINSSISFEWLALDKANTTSVINALSTTATGQTITFNKSARESTFTDDEWATLIATKPNWTFSLL